MAEGKVILVVEDNEQNLELVEFLLEESGAEVRKARDASETWEQLALGAPDLILMDMQLPEADGLTLVAQIRRDATLADIPVIALTAHAMRGDRERFIAGGCDGYISKPINVETFVSEVKRILDSGGGAPPSGSVTA